MSILCLRAAAFLPFLMLGVISQGIAKKERIVVHFRDLEFHFLCERSFLLLPTQKKGRSERR